MTDRKTFKLNDMIIGQIRDLLQLSLITNTSVVDHLRALVVEQDGEAAHYLTLSPEYVEAYNSQIESLAKAAEEAMKNHQEELLKVELNSDGTSN